MIRHLIFVSLLLGWAPQAAAAPWSVGSVLEADSSGLSLLYRHRAREAVHVSATFFEAERFSVEGDWQRFFVPSGRSFDYQLYSGIGMRGEALRAEEEAEVYELSLPIGMQWTPEGLPIELFAEAGALMGPLPATHVKGRMRGGLRAVF